MLEDLHIQGSEKTPEIHFKYQKGELFIGGISIPENTVEFYHNVMNWITLYLHEPQENTRIIFKLEYFNTSSSVVFLNIFKMINDLKSNLVIDWYYEEDDTEIFEVGNDLKRMVVCEFNLIPLASF